MSETYESEDEDRHARWVAMWQHGVRASPGAIGLADLSTARFIELSPCAAELLGTTVQDGIGLSYLTLVEPASAAADAFRLAREGIIDGTQTRRRLRRLDGSTIDVRATGWAIRSPAGPDLGLWMASEVRAAEQAALAEQVVAPSFPRRHHSVFAGDQVSLDERWRVTEIHSTGGLFLGRALDGLVASSFIDLIHPEDLAALLFAIARATSDTSVSATVRLRHEDGTWRAIQAVPTALGGEGTSPVAFVLAAEPSADASEPGTWVGDAPRHLRRIADQIEAAGVLAPLAETAGALGIATATDLTPRQWEIVSRLLRGERVGTIAAEIYLSPSTVRNHLAAIFAKVGVHSQAELIALYRNGGTR